MTPTVYHYHADTGAFLYAAPARPSPLEPEVFLVPAHATLIAPPTVGAQEVAVFQAGAWQVQADWRAVSLFSTADGSAISISEIGRTPSDVQATTAARPSPAHVWRDQAWVLDPAQQQALLDTAQTRALAQLAQLHTQTLQTLIGNPSQAEQDSWSFKLTIAHAILQRNPLHAAAQAFLNATELTDSASQIAWATRVMGHATRYAQALALVEQLRQNAYAALRAAADSAALEQALQTQTAAYAEALNTWSAQLASAVSSELAQPVVPAGGWLQWMRNWWSASADERAA